MAVRILDWDLCMKTVLDLLAQSMGNNDVENFFLWCCGPKRVMVSSFLRFLYHTQRRTTVGRTPLDE